MSDSQSSLEAKFEQQLGAIAAQLQRIEDLEAIKQLKARYCAICDDDHNPDLITSVFTEDAIWEGPGIGKAEGHDGIRALFQQFQKTMSYSQHMTMNPIIELDDDGVSATGTWTFFGPFTFYKGNRARWQATRYAETYRKGEAGWRIAHLRIAGPSMTADYHRGWGDAPAKDSG